MNKYEDSELVRTAILIEDGLQALEALAASMQKIRLHTDKAIQRAARELEEGMKHQEKLAEALQAFAGVIARLQQRQQEMTNALGALAGTLQQRSARLATQMQRYAELGAQAAELTEMLAGAQDQSNAQEILATTDEKLGTVIEAARSIASGAEDEDFIEVSKEAKSLGQRLQSIRAKIRAVKQ